jgi:hypothetical protein
LPLVFLNLTASTARKLDYPIPGKLFFLFSRSWFGIKPEAKEKAISIGSVG